MKTSTDIPATLNRARVAVLALFVAGTLSLAASLAVAQTGGPYDMSWSTIDAGGGTSTGGPYTLSDTIGQPEPAGPATGGPYTLVDGFWAINIGEGAQLALHGILLY